LDLPANPSVHWVAQDALTREEEPMKRKRTKQVPGYQVQPKMPVSIGLLGAVCVDADFTAYDDIGPCVEALVRLGTISSPYTLVLTYEQALQADIIEKV
jgi:hypothetical protein